MQQHPTPKWSYAAVAGLVVALALVLRLPGYGGRALWLDELWRVNLMLDDNIFERYWHSPDVYTAITAPLYLILNKVIAFFGLAPEILRLSSLVPGLASVVMAFLLARKVGAGLLLASTAALLFAVNNDFVRYSNEYKPYMFEVFVHLCCTYVWLDLVLSEAPPRTKWLTFFGVFAVAVFCSPTVVFLLPAAGVSILVHVWPRAQRHLGLAITGFGGLGLLVLLLYVFVWSYGSDKELVSYWANGFYKLQEDSYLVFVAERLFAFWRGSFATVGASKLLPLVTLIMFFTVSAYALTTKVESRPRFTQSVVAFYIVFLLTLLLLNYAELWPIGRLRPNQFVYAHFTMMFMFALISCQKLRVRQNFGIIIIILVLLGASRTNSLKLAEMGPPTEQSDKVWEAFMRLGQAGQIVDSQCAKAAVNVFFNPSMGHAITYFVRHDQSINRAPSVLKQSCVRLIGTSDAYADAAKTRQQILDNGALNEPFWFIYSHLTDAEVAVLKSVAGRFGVLSSETAFVGAGFFQVTPPQLQHGQAK